MSASVRRIAFVSPRFPEGPTVGGAETLLKTQALYAARAGLDVTCLTTCARNHFTWENEVAPGERTVDGLRVRFFPVDSGRDLATFLDVQGRISNRRRVTPEEEMDWLRNNVNSSELCRHLAESPAAYDRVLLGPYLFGLTYFAAHAAGSRAVLVPCLHDEPFAYLSAFRGMFENARTVLFNSEPERDLAAKLYGGRYAEMPVVGMGLEPFVATPGAFAARRGIGAPYVIYSGRREPLKGTPLLLAYMDTFRQRNAIDIKVVLTGTGQIEPPASLVPHIVDAGFLGEQEKHEAMAGALAFCHPSVNESFGIVIMESWLAGTPVVVHAAGDVLRHHCQASNGGLWFRNYPEFEEILLRLLGQPGLRDTLGAAGRAYVVRRFSPAAASARLLEALER